MRSVPADPRLPAATPRCSRRPLLLAAALAALLPAGRRARAQDLQFFRIGTGSVSGTYYPIGGLIADIISLPAGTPCDRADECGVPGLVAIAQTSEGSVANIRAITAGELESGFAQSDVAYGAYSGTGVFAGRPPAHAIAAVANLYRESVHLVVRADAGIARVSDLHGKRVSLDRPGSGTRVDALLILAAYGLAPADLEVVEAAPDEAVDRVHAGDLDAFFLVAGHPAAAVSELTQAGQAELLPLVGDEISGLIDAYPFFARQLIPDGTYRGLPAIQTIAVGAQWLVAAALADELVYMITRALWRPNAQAMLEQGHPRGRDILRQHALDGVAIPLHPGALRYYREAGLVP